MAKLKESECEAILKAAGGVFGDMGFIGTDYITTPVRKPEGRELHVREQITITRSALSMRRSRGQHQGV